MQVQASKTKWHFWTSIVKSVFRITAGVALIKNQIILAGILLIAAELLGIVEEL
jgi:hypothetical protein